LLDTLYLPGCRRCTSVAERAAAGQDGDHEQAHEPSDHEDDLHAGRHEAVDQQTRDPQAGDHNRERERRDGDRPPPVDDEREQHDEHDAERDDFEVETQDSPALQKKRIRIWFRNKREFSTYKSTQHSFVSPHKKSVSSHLSMEDSITL